MLGQFREYVTELEIFSGPLLALELDSRCLEEEGREGRLGRGERREGGRERGAERWKGKMSGSFLHRLLMT